MNFLACDPGRPRDGMQEKGVTMETSKNVTEPLRLKTRIHLRMLTVTVEKHE